MLKDQNKSIHFIGICGAGMSAVAKLYRDAGWQVSGSDDEYYPPISTFVEDLGIPFAHGYAKENIPQNTNIVVIGKHAKLVPETNAEVSEAFVSGRLVLSLPEALSRLIGQARTLQVVGSYGKSTTASCVAWCLKKAGKQPGFFIGALPYGLPPAELGQGGFWVIEGDEYPSSNWDSTSKFLRYPVSDILLTSADHDHLNVFPTHASYLEPFQTLLRKMPQNGLLICSADNPAALNLARESGRKSTTYGLDARSDWSARNIHFDQPTVWEIYHGDKKQAEISTKLLGRHNIQNLLGAACYLLESGQLSLQEIVDGLTAFAGVKRRLDTLSNKSTVKILEGFGSSYHKTRSAIEAIKLHFPSQRLIVIFEPHTFSWRSRQAAEWYETAFTGTGTVLVLDPPTHGRHTHDQLSPEEILNAITHAGVAAHALSLENAQNIFDQIIQKNDVVLILSSGGTQGIIPNLISFLENKFPE